MQITSFSTKLVVFMMSALEFNEAEAKSEFVLSVCLFVARVGIRSNKSGLCFFDFQLFHC